MAHSRKRLAAKVAKTPNTRILELPQYPKATFVVTTTCIVDGKSLGSNISHAHARPRAAPDEFGIVCIRPKWADDPKAQATAYAHILAPGGHTARWRQTISDLGYPEVAARYEQRYPASRRAAKERAEYEEAEAIVLEAMTRAGQG